ncbi:hypothetical protein L484_010144 [Morus notabilis]|uniref:Uncharacterized protein n=1 Tax=Morus notabilis TaxID=981085 RepID=W9RHH9_9ROSA|nr:hypothetical protein L484_010144 [Morus notabilis]
MGNNLGEFTKFLVLDSVHKHPLHILDLLREVLLLDNPNVFHQNECIPTNLIRRLCSLLCHCACRAVAFISRILKRFNKSESLPQYWSMITQYSFPNVQELKKAGIEFKPSDSLTTISFRSSFFTTAQLKLPRLVVDNLTVKMLFNLAAYEMCLSEFHPNQKPWFMSYINLLDLLVDDEHDVKDLKAADILPKLHISDAEVANLINGMGSEFLPPDKDTYAHVKKKIEKHCRSRSRRRCALWIAQDGTKCGIYSAGEMYVFGLASHECELCKESGAPPSVVVRITAAAVVSLSPGRRGSACLASKPYLSFAASTERLVWLIGYFLF